MLASRIVELSCLFWSARVLWKVFVSGFGRHSGPGCAWRAILGFLGSSGPFDVIFFRSVSGAKFSKK